MGGYDYSFSYHSSLLTSIDFIKKKSDRALIIAVDTSYEILLKNNIVPHFCISVDPQIVNAKYFEVVETERTILVADPVVHPLCAEIL